jgi:VWFA-related protein
MKTIQSTMLAAVLILCGAVFVYAQQAQQAGGAQQSSTPATGAQSPASAAGAASPQAQAPVQQSPLHGPALKSETREVRVDVIVTDKKGAYIHDLKKEEFKIWEDNKEQPVNSFTFGADPNAPLQAQRHYMVLYFDNSSMDLSDQPRARAAAMKFIDANAGPDRVMAVMDFGGTLRVEQNFTTDVPKLKDAVTGIQGSATSPSETASSTGSMANPGFHSLGNAAADFGAYTLLLSIRNVAKNLSEIPGRKSLILFTAGFSLNSERMSELTATVDACNKANVAVYPVDVRGLTTMMTKNSAPREGDSTRIRLASLRKRDEIARPTATLAAVRRSHATNADSSGSLRCVTHSAQGLYRVGCGAAAIARQPERRNAAYDPRERRNANLILVASPQHGGGGGGGGHAGGGGGGTTGGGGGTTGGGGTGHGGTTGGTGGGGTGGRGGGAPGNINNMNNYNNQMNQSRLLLPHMPASAATNQQVMYMLAEGTGGFPILNTNDLLGGLQKIASEQDEYYLLGYVPAESAEGSCHTLKVKVERSGMNVRARSGYCNVKSNDLLAGKPVENELEAHATSGSPAANVAALASGASGAAAVANGSFEVPYFYTAANEARVDVAAQLPASDVVFTKEKGKYRADVNILGVAKLSDGTVAAHFSDEVTMDLEKDDYEAFQKKPMQYENQFLIAPGKYNFTLVVGGGPDKFSKLESSLAVDPFDGKKMALSSPVLSNQMAKLSDDTAALDAELISDKVPLIVKGIQLTPSSSNHFKKSETLGLYAQIFVPQLGSSDMPPSLTGAKPADGAASAPAANAAPATSAGASTAPATAGTAAAAPAATQVKVKYVIQDVKTKKVVYATSPIDVTSFGQPGNPVVSFALKVPVDTLAPGDYTLLMQASDNANNMTPIRSTTFSVE